MKLKILLLLSLTYIIAISCSCPLEPASNTANMTCTPLEATVTEFNPNITTKTLKDSKGNDSIVYEPVAKFSIHSYQFPFDETNSGTTPNDSRFAKSATFPLADSSFYDSTTKKVYRAAIKIGAPDNPSINGDFLVISETNVQDSAIANRSAKIRVKGKIFKTTHNILNEAANDYCTLFKSLASEVPAYRLGAKQYGGNSNSTFADSNITVTDPSGNSNSTVKVPSWISDFLKSASSKKIINDVDVKIGDVFYYEAINGREFIFAITDIQQAALTPNKNHLSIMFSRIK